MQESGHAHLCHPQDCQGSRAINHVGMAVDVLSFSRQNVWGWGRKSKRSIKHLCGAGRDKAQLDGLWLSGFGPSSANYVGKWDQRSGPHLAN